MHFYKKYLPVAMMVLLFTGCAAKPKGVWSLILDGQSALMDQSGKIVWQGDGEAVRNEWGNFVVTDWRQEKPLQSIISPKGEVLLQAKHGEQLLQLSETLIAVQPEGEQWTLSTGQNTYVFDRAEVQPNGQLLLCGLEEGGSLLLDAQGKEQRRFAQDFLWAASGLDGWYQSGDLLLDDTGAVRYSGVQRMVGQGRVLLQTDTGYRVVQADTGEELYAGEQNWRVYLDGLKLEQSEQGISFVVGGTEYHADFLNSWPYSGQPVYYLAQGAQMQALWNAQGEQLFLRPAADWMEIVGQGHIACLEQETLKMLDEQGNTLWEQAGYNYVWTAKSGEQLLLCASRAQQQLTDVFSMEGECLWSGLEAIYEITENGVSAQKDGVTGVLNQKGGWICRAE